MTQTLWDETNQRINLQPDRSLDIYEKGTIAYSEGSCSSRLSSRCLEHLLTVLMGLDAKEGEPQTAGLYYRQETPAALEENWVPVTVEDRNGVLGILSEVGWTPLSLCQYRWMGPYPNGFAPQHVSNMRKRQRIANELLRYTDEGIGTLSGEDVELLRATLRATWDKKEEPEEAEPEPVEEDECPEDAPADIGDPELAAAYRLGVVTGRITEDSLTQILFTNTKLDLPFARSLARVLHRHITKGDAP